jgi:hypothetical protein
LASKSNRALDAAEKMGFVVVLAVAGAEAHLLFKVYGTTEVVP